jgi:hypothetical protein
MAISRPLLLALLGAVLLGATFFAVQNARDNSSEPAAESSAPADQAAVPAESASPEQAIAGALDGSLESATFSAKLAAKGAGQSGSVSVQGAFETPAKGEVPEFEISVKASGTGMQLDTGFVSTGDAAYMTEGDKAYRVPASVWAEVVEAAGSENAAAQAELPIDLQPQNWLRDVKQADSETIDGVETTHVSASLDLAAMLNDLAAAAQLAGAPTSALPPGLEQQAAEAVKRAELDVYVGQDDELLRRAEAAVEIAPPGGQSLELNAEVDLTAVNEAQDIEAPDNVVSGVPTGPAGELAKGLLGAVGASEAAAAPSLAALATNNPQKAARAVAAHKKVVILFRNPRGLDDREVVAAVRTVDQRTKAVVLTDHVDAVERYGKLVKDLGVSQSPSIVIIDTTGKARLIEGYVDTASLTQAVADAR